MAQAAAVKRAQPAPLREFMLRIMLGQIKAKIERDPKDAIEFIDAILEGRASDDNRDEGF